MDQLREDYWRPAKREPTLLAADGTLWSRKCGVRRWSFRLRRAIPFPNDERWGAGIAWTAFFKPTVMLSHSEANVYELCFVF
jgi:hypothetical protein